MPQKRGAALAYYTVGDLISRQAKARGRKLAIASDEGSLSYGELDRVTAALAVLFRTTLRKGKLKLPDQEIKSAAFVSKLPAKATPSVRYFWARQFPQTSARKNTLDL